MTVWVSIATTRSHLAGGLEQSLRETVEDGVAVQIISFRFDPISPEWEAQRSLSTLLKARPDVEGLLFFEAAAFRLLHELPRKFRIIFAPAELPQWNASLTTANRVQVIEDILALKPYADDLEVCAPQTTSWHSFALTTFAAKCIDAQLPVAAPASAADNTAQSVLSVGFLSGMTVADAELAADFISRLLEVARDENGVRVFVPRDSFELGPFQALTANTRIDFVAGEPPRDRRDAGGDFLVISASDLCRLGENLLLGYRSGATIVVVDRDPDCLEDIRAFDAAGNPVSLAEFATQSETRFGLYRDQAKRAAKLSKSAATTWRRLLGGPVKVAKEKSTLDPVDSPVLHAVLRGAKNASSAERQFMAMPGSPQTILNAAATLAARNDSSKWFLIGLAQKAARISRLPVRVPKNLHLAADDMFISPRDYPAQASELKAWLGKLPVDPGVGFGITPAPIKSREPAAKESPIAYSTGLGAPGPNGRRHVSNTGALVLVSSPVESGDIEVGVELTFAESSRSPVGRATVTVGSAAPQTVAISAGGSQTLRIRQGATTTGSAEIPLTIVPVAPLPSDRLMLAQVTACAPKSEDEGSSTEADGFETIYSCSLERDVISGAFDLEHDGTGIPFRWVASNFSIRLPLSSLGLNDYSDGSRPPCILLRLARPARNDLTPLSVKIMVHDPDSELPRTIICRRVGNIGKEVLFGAVLGRHLEDGLLRVSLSEQGGPLNALDRRFASARLTAAWVARPREEKAANEIPALSKLDIHDPSQFAEGWHPIEQIQERPSRRMSKRAVLSSRLQFAPRTRIFLALSGPVVSDVPSSVELAVALDGQRMVQMASMRGERRWVKLYEGDRAGDAIGGAQFELELQDSNENNAIGSPTLPVFQAMLIYPDGVAERPRDDNRGDATLITQSLGWENWEGGLSGVWLPSHAMLIAIQRANTDTLVLVGAAATDSHAVARMTVHLDDMVVPVAGEQFKDGSWSLSSAIPFAHEGTACLLRLETPGASRVLLREVQFT